MKTVSKTKKTEEQLTTKTTTALAAPAIDFAADAGRGTEGADKASFAIPFIAVLQGLSPQLETVDGAKPGMFINTITNEVFKEVLVIPCAFQRRYLRWAPRAAGGGYKGELNPVDVETGKLPGVTQTPEGKRLIDGDELKDTRNHFVLARSAETGVWQPAIISLTSTQIKKSKRWLSRIQSIELKDAQGRSFNPPSFSHVYRLTTVKEENEKGAWHGVEVNLVGPVTEAEAYGKAKAFHKSVTAGDVEVAPPVPETEHDGRF